MGQIRVLNEQGDISIEWSPKNKAATKKARAEFDRLKADGYRFYSVEETRGHAVDEFDPNAGKLLAAPGAASKADRETGTRPSAMRGGPTAQVARSGR